MTDGIDTKADELIAERAQQDFEEGLAWMRERIRDPSRHNMFVAKAMEAGVMGAVSTLQLRPRYREDVLFLIGLAHRVNAGEDPALLAKEHMPRAIRMRELSLVARTKEPEFARILEISEATFTARLPDLARMAAVQDPIDYPHLVRTAFPDVKYVEDFIVENGNLMREMVDHIEAHPKLLRVPGAFVRTLSGIAREMIDWESERVLASVRAMYDAP